MLNKIAEPEPRYNLPDFVKPLDDQRVNRPCVGPE